ncbi:MAG: pimeloyl-ACP methyl ester carboxylesterase [Pseudohongiellaceae bacterium]|jgi:pimeloyl-ACP methyl ester carboxylesterase
MEKVSGELHYDRFIVPYRKYGTAKKAIVCLSGAKQTMSAWRSFISYFHHEYSVVVFDMPGQGRAQIISGAAGVPLDEQVNVLHHIVLDAFDDSVVEKYVFGGSWGSIVAAAYAERHPDVFDRVILGSFGTKPNMVLSSIIDQVQVMIGEGCEKDIAPMMIEKFGQYIPEILKRQIIAQFDKMTEAQFQSFYEHSVFVTQMGDLKTLVNLKNIQAPTLVVMGQYDTIMDLFDTRKATKLIPNGEFLLIKGAGHFLHWEKEQILSVYAEFFQRKALDANIQNTVLGECK